MSRASTPTLLSLDRFAKILQLNPVHFSGGVGSLIWPINGACADVWPQYSWQTSHELVGREEVAQTIATVEQDIKDAMGASAAATWEVEEQHAWAYRSGVQTDYGHVIASGRRAVTEIDLAAAVVRSDPDGDGWFERATVTVTTALTDPREIKVYFAGHDGDPEWEIRPLRGVTIASGTATILIDSWLLFDPDLWEEFPNTSTPFSGIDVTVDANFVSTVDVYREFNDNSEAGVNFFAGGDGYACCGGSGCDVCNGTTSEGCFSIVESRLGFVKPFPATYSDGSWAYDYSANCGRSNRIALSYYAGMRDKGYLSSKSLDPLPLNLAEAIAWMSAARLPAAICNCNNVKDVIESLQKDASTFRDGAAQAALYSKFQKQDIFNNPFGTRWGEVRAWQRVVRIVGQIGGGGAL